MKKNLINYVGILFFIISVLGFIYACRVSVAQNMYFRAKFLVSPEDLNTMLTLCKSATQIYRYNYYFCILTAENAYYSSFKKDGKETLSRIIEAQRWCDAGLKLNPCRVQLRRLKTCLIARNSPSDAVRYWEKYVDWQFWDSANHALLVELYALTGQYEKAMDSLSLIKDSPHYLEASKKLNEAWKKEKELPLELSQKVTRKLQR